MRRIFLLFLIPIALAVLVVQGLKYDPGYVQISFGHWLVETNIWVLIALNIAALLVLSFTVSLFKTLGGGVNGVNHWLRIRPKKKANKETQRGLLAFLEGDWEKAQTLLTRAAQHARMPLINLLAAANAAHQQGEHKQSASLLKQAHDLEGSSELAASLTQTRLYIESDRYEAALAVVLQLKKKHPNHPYVTQLLVQIYTALEDWEQLVVCLEDDTTKQLKLDEGFERQAWSKLFASKANKIHDVSQHSNQDNRQNNGEKNSDQARAEILTEKLSEVWKRVPSKYRFDEQVIYAYTRELLKFKLNDEAEVILRKALDKAWSENLIDAYGLTSGTHPTEQLLHAEKWLHERPNSPRLLLTLGRLSLKCELWGKAIEYLNESQKQQSSLEASAELYRLSCHLNKDEKETDALLGTLMHHIHLPDLPQPR